MILFVGDKLKFGGLLEVATIRFGKDAAFAGEQISIKKQENEILKKAEEIKAEYIVYDIGQYFDEPREIISIIRRIQKVNHAKPILYVETDNPKAEIVKEAVSMQIKSFINKNRSMSEQKDEFEKILLNFYEANKRDDVALIEDEVMLEHKTLNEFVGELYDAKQREEERENTVIINKKRKSEVVIWVFISILRASLAAVSVALMVLAIVSLIYEESRLAIFNVLSQIYEEVTSMCLGSFLFERGKNGKY